MFRHPWELDLHQRAHRDELTHEAHRRQMAAAADAGQPSVLDRLCRPIGLALIATGERLAARSARQATLDPRSGGVATSA